MIQIDRTYYRRYKSGEISAQDFADYLLRTFPASEIALALTECMEYDIKPIPITEEEFRLHFRIKGTREGSDGQYIKETRGRRPTITKE